MKKVILLIVALMLVFRLGYGQQKKTLFCSLIVGSLHYENKSNQLKVRIYVDIPQAPKNDTTALNTFYEVEHLQNIPEALNYMTSRGWRYIFSLAVTAGYENSESFLYLRSNFR